MRVRTGTRKRSRRSRQQGVPKLFSPDGSESGHQGRSNARAKFLNLASVARNRFPQVGPEKQANLAYSPSTPSSLQKIEAGSDGSNLASQSFDGSSAFFDAPAVSLGSHPYHGRTDQIAGCQHSQWNVQGCQTLQRRHLDFPMAK